MPQSTDPFISLLIDVIKVIVSGSIGGFIGSRIALRQFQSQARYQAKHNRYLEQINAIREILVMLPVIFRDIHLNWELPPDSPVNSKQHISDLTEQLFRMRSLFLDDIEALKIVDSTYSLIGESIDGFLLPGREMPGAIIEKIRLSAEEKIKEIEAKAF